MDEIRFPEKKVDEAWKQAVEEERQRLEAAASARERKPAASSSNSPGSTPSVAAAESAALGNSPKSEPVTNKSFLSLLQMLAMQAYLALGEMENPVTGGVQVNLQQAKAFIDLLAMLQEKTQGNLSKEEEDSLNGVVYELQMKFREHQAGLR